MHTFTSQKDIEDWLIKAGIFDFVLVPDPETTSLENSTYMVNVNESVTLQDFGLEFIPVKFNEVRGSFNCAYNQLTTLQNAPREVGRKFDCSHNKLTSLEGGPISVGQDYLCYRNCLSSLKFVAPQVTTLDCSNNQLTDMLHCPEAGVLRCQHNCLVSIEGCERISVSMVCSDNELTSLKGAPKELDGYFDCSFNQLTSLQYGPQRVADEYNCSENQINTLLYFPKQGNGVFFIAGNRLGDIEEEQDFEPLYEYHLAIKRVVVEQALLSKEISGSATNTKKDNLKI